MFSYFRPWVMEGSPCDGEEAAKDPAARQPPLGELSSLHLLIRESSAQGADARKTVLSSVYIWPNNILKEFESFLIP